MSDQSLAIVVTSINSSSQGLSTIGRRALERNFQAIMVGDRKGPEAFDTPGIDFYSLARQRDTGYRTAIQGPVDTYTRKLTGYLIAIAGGADFIRETDDDNTPYDNFFEPIPSKIDVRQFTAAHPWINICSAFTRRHVWPRGFPLDQIHNPLTRSFEWESELLTLPSTHLVLQALADGDPDVDAVYRLSAADTSDITFDQADPILIPHNTWVPFNSQATTWPRRLFPLLYLPSTCSFRMTDIWRSFVAQRLMRALDSHLVYISPTVHQTRNDHDLMRDFTDEIKGYTGYHKLTYLLESLDLLTGEGNIGENLRCIYRAMADSGFVDSTEMSLLEAWLSDLADSGIEL